MIAAQRLEPRAQPLSHHARVLGETLIAQHLVRVRVRVRV